MRIVQLEPALIMAVIQAGIGLGLAFGLHLTGEQIAGIMAFSAAVLAVISRALTTPNVRVQKEIVEAVSKASPTLPSPAGTDADVHATEDKQQ